MRRFLLALCAAGAMMAAVASAPVPPGKPAPKPLYRDPVFDGAADPVVVWNAAAQRWWMFYTNRRASAPGLSGVAWVHGTAIGIAESADGGAEWRYVDTADIRVPADVGGKTPSFWAPDVTIAPDGTAHMFLTVVPGVFDDWQHPRTMTHLTSRDLRTWTFVSAIPLASDRVIDANVLRLPDGTWRMWYNDERDGKAIDFADSPDLSTWTDRGRAAGVGARCEGPFVFRWKGKSWMLVDTWKGLGVYRSDDLLQWTGQPDVLLGTPGKGSDDGVVGGHPGVVVSGDRAYCFYFTHPDRAEKAELRAPFPNPRRSSIQVVELFERGGRITCDRDRPTFIQLLPPR